MSENAPGRRTPGADGSDGTTAHDVQTTQDVQDALLWRERDRERARLLLERANDIARRIERACGTHLGDTPQSA
ncbi:MAG: hypothetical protein HOV68_31255 [Streptomycetaceae bacterium]|nr:hypothetical protein [Streptomycetaceae bacterium]